MAFTENFRQIEFNPDKEIREVFRATQGDTKSQGFNVVVFLGGEKKVITTETMSFFAQKPDGTRVVDTAVKDGDGFKIELKNQVFAVPGIVVCTLVLRGANGEKLAGRQFKIFVASSMEDGAIISEDEREILDKAFDLATDIVPRLEGLDLVRLETAEIKETERLASETIRLASEQGRVDAEATRVQKETERKQNEEARENNEGKRVTAENKRESAETERKNAETSRVSAENDRTTAETARVEAETTRAGFYDTYNQELTEIKADIDYTDEQLALKADLSEIEVARGTEPTLGARLDADKAETEQEIMSFKEEYVNYIDSELDFVLRELPNGTKDEVRVSGGKAEHIQRNKKYVLQASDIKVLNTNTINIDRVILTNVLPDANKIDWALSTECKSVVIDGFVAKLYSDTIENIGAFYGSLSSDLVLCVAKGTYTSIADAQSKLAGTELTYQLAEPIITELALDDLSPNTQQIVKLSSKVEKLTNAIIALGGTII